MRKKRKVIPMPTEEEKARAKLKAAGSDPLVWAMKAVDDEFPDSREKTAETIKAEETAEMTMGPAVKEPENTDEDILEDSGTDSQEIAAEGKTAMPMDDGVVTMEVTPMRQNVDNVSLDEVKNKPDTQVEEAETAEVEKTDDKKSKKIRMVKKIGGKKEKDSDASGHKTQVKLTSLESKQKKMMIAFAVLVVLALGGMTFGIVAVVKQNNTTRELAEQIAASSTASSDEQTDGEYIYLKDWGVKIKIPDNLVSVSYDMDMDDYSEALIWGVRKESGSSYTPDFAKQNKNPDAMGMMTRVPRYERMSAGRLIWYDDYYNYYYKGPSGEPEASEEEMSWWVESYLLIKEMLTNADNYTRIEDETIGQQ